ncbi:hypothetical protein BGX29_012143 [Mortierella sp. GBA35]|nr:hypothetical protein BGX29_012143 [Mortierella sp. GBA35]
MFPHELFTSFSAAFPTSSSQGRSAATSNNLFGNLASQHPTNPTRGRLLFGQSALVPFVPTSAQTQNPSIPALPPSNGHIGQIEPFTPANWFPYDRPNQNMTPFGRLVCTYKPFQPPTPLAIPGLLQFQDQNQIQATLALNSATTPTNTQLEQELDEQIRSLLVFIEYLHKEKDILESEKDRNYATLEGKAKHDKMMQDVNAMIEECSNCFWEVIRRRFGVSIAYP